MNSDGTEICNPNEIIDEQVNFYSDLYKSKKRYIYSGRSNRDFFI